MNYLKLSGNSSYKDEVAEFLYQSYVARGGAAQFIVDQTDLFSEHDGKRFYPYPKQVHFMNLLKPTDRVIVVLKSRQCLSKDTMIYTPNGIFTIKELYESKYRGKVYTYDDNNNLVEDEIIDIWESGEKEIYETKVCSGESIETSSKHKINIVDKGFTEIKDIQKKDKIVTFEGQFGETSISDEEAILMGYFITDGSYSNANPKFTNINLNYLSEFENCLNKVFPNTKINKVKKGNGYDYVVSAKTYTGKMNDYSQYLSDYGLRNLINSDKILPNFFLNLDKHSTSVLLNRIFAGDGWYSTNRTYNKYGNPHYNHEVGIGSPSLKFLHQISFLLSKFGIHSNIIKSKEIKAPNKDFYKLRIYRADYINIFQEQIGIFDKGLNKPIKIKNFSKKDARTLRHVKSLNKTEMTYDLTTKKYHSYIANGIHVHNSGFSTSVVGRAVYEAMFNKVPEIIIISATRTAAEKVLDRIQKAFESMHVSIRPEFKRANKQYLEFFNGVKIYSLASNPDGMRGFTGIAYLDEFAMLRTTVSEEAYKAVYPMTTKGGRIVIISTPKGCEGKFYDLATKSLAEISGQAVKHEKVMYKINWRDVPFIKDAVEQNGLFDGLSPEEIRQEYELEFLTDDEMPFFSQQFLMDNFVEHDDFDIPLFTDINDLGIDDSYIDDYEKPLDSSLYLKNNQNISHLYDRYESYTFGFDPASTNDDSILAILGKRRGLNKKEVIGEFILNKITENTIDQAKFSLRLVDMFNPNALNLDYNGLGRGIGDFYKSVERVEDVLNCIEYTRQSKVDDFQDLKDEISKQQIKRRYDGNKDDTYKLKQAQRLFYKDGRIFGKGGKDDYFNAIMLANKYDESVQAGFYFA